ncbi:MAG: M24 family metallopeptidase [Planctomycetota bacterium]|jgi:Xaa-Pro aminopeptidase
MSSNESPLLSEATQASCQRRLERLRQRLDADGLGGLLVSNEKDILYLTGFVGHDSYLLVLPDAAVIVCDTRYDEYLEPWRRCGYAEVVMGTRHRLEDSVKTICSERKVASLGYSSEYTTVDRRDKLAATVGEGTLKKTSGIVSLLRMKKDEHEVSRIEQAIHWQQDALQAALGHLQIGMSELEFCARIDYEMKVRGAFGPSFDAIVGSGPNSSVPHHQTGQTRIHRGVLLVDWGAATPDGYNSDLTRTFGVGEMPEQLRHIYSIVLDAQLSAIDACAPGRTCAEVDGIARKIISDAGYGEHFGHGLGHGLGLEVHESPYFNELQTDIVLEPGMLMTVEPGIYLPGVGGIRIEDDVLITDSGHRVLSNWPKTLDSAIVEPSHMHQPVA